MSGTDDFESNLADSPAAVAEFEDQHKGLLSRFQHTLHVNPALVPLIVLVLSIAIFGVLLGSKFFSPFALTLILQQVQIVGVLAAAQSLIILTAGIDLSVGAIAVMTSVIMGQFTFRYGLPPSIAIPCGLLAGTLIGALNGWLVARVKLPPFIVTLGMWQIVLAANYIYSANETIRSQDIEAEASLLHFFGIKFKFAGATVTLGVVFMVRHNRSDRKYPIYHRRSDWRHISLWRARLDHGGLFRRSDCRRLRAGLADVRRGPAMDVFVDRCADHPLDHADFELYPGEVLAIIGDNGAGKSTMIKAVSGAVIPDEGEVLLEGQPVNFASPIQAREHGIETVYQTLAMSWAACFANSIAKRWSAKPVTSCRSWA